MPERDKRYPKAFKHLMKFEGGYAHDPNDSGGETFRGISRRSWPDWQGWALVDVAKKELGGVKLTGKYRRTNIDDFFYAHPQIDTLVEDFYFYEFWSPAARLELPPRITEQLFDSSVHMGLEAAIMLLQAAAYLSDENTHLTVDGKAGKLTLAALDAILSHPNGEERLLITYGAVQSGFYIGLARAKPSQKKFLNGWLKRAKWVPE